ncbi:MAG: HD domain-containing protein [Thermoleophilia bacterium]
MGGTVRDLRLGLDPRDIDIVIDGDPESLARRFSDSIGGGFFVMSEEFKACRAISADGRVNYDFTACRGGHIIKDLGERDFSVNAMAVTIPGGGEIIDPFGGQAHLAGRELVPVEDAIFDRDPLRLLRAVRLEKTRGLVIGPPLARLIQSKAEMASLPSVERSFVELCRIVGPPSGSAGIRRLDELGLLDVLLPEITALKDVTQNQFHHLDVFDHVLASMDELEWVMTSPESAFPGRGKQLQERLGQKIAGGADCSLALTLAALFHDIAKPYCRFTDDDGLVRFFEHDRRGSEMVSAILGRYKTGNRLIQVVAHLVNRHMRFEGLVQQDPPSERARLRYLRATEPWTPEAIMLSVSDRRSVRGPRVTEADIERHLEISRAMMELAFTDKEALPLPKLVSGDELILELGLSPGPMLGVILDHIREEQELGNIETREQALAESRRLLGNLGLTRPEE